MCQGHTPVARSLPADLTSSQRVHTSRPAPRGSCDSQGNIAASPSSFLRRPSGLAAHPAPPLLAVPLPAGRSPPAHSFLPLFGRVFSARPPWQRRKCQQLEPGSPWPRPPADSSLFDLILPICTVRSLQGQDGFLQVEAFPWGVPTLGPSSDLCLSSVQSHWTDGLANEPSGPGGFFGCR